MRPISGPKRARLAILDFYRERRSVPSGERKRKRFTFICRSLARSFNARSGRSRDFREEYGEETMWRRRKEYFFVVVEVFVGNDFYAL